MVATKTAYSQWQMENESNITGTLAWITVHPGQAETICQPEEVDGEDCLLPWGRAFPWPQRQTNKTKKSEGVYLARNLVEDQSWERKI